MPVTQTPAPTTMTLTAHEYADWLVAQMSALPGHLSSRVRSLRVWEGTDTGVVRIYRGEDYVQVDCGEHGGHYGHALRAVVGRDRGFQAALRATGDLVIAYNEADRTIDVVA